MSDLETTELKLTTTPTGGVSGEHSPYYRRLLSAGYKGFMQGTIGGAGLYGLFGAVIGGLIAVPAMFIPGVNVAAALTLVPAMAGVGVLKGANTFGNIGTVAAISAESADLAEQRRYLLDRYYELPDTPDGDKQAEVIKQALQTQYSSGKKHPMFHWRTIAICAAIGATLALAFTAFPPLAAILEHTALGTAMGAMEGALGHGLATAAIAGIGTAIGALSGAIVGVDRMYVRKWFDRSEKLIYDDSHSWNALQERSHLVERIKEAAKQDEQTRLILERRKGLSNYNEPLQNQHHTAVLDAQPATKPIASLDASPDTKVSSAHLQERMADIQHVLQGI